MKSVRRRDTEPEITLRRDLWRLGLRYRTHVKSLPGSPDIVFRREKIAIFVDGDYWHGRILIEQGRRALRESFRRSDREFWVLKITRNVDRDCRQTNELREMGWSVIRLWERDILRESARVAVTISRQVARRRIRLRQRLNSVDKGRLPT
jgi:DNA mismatch endonuclease, patch repair protein